MQDNLTILSPELSLPWQSQVPVSIYLVALNILSCLDTLSLSLEKGLAVENTYNQKEETQSESKVEDFSFVNRFEGLERKFFYLAVFRGTRNGSCLLKNTCEMIPCAVYVKYSCPNCPHILYVFV